MYARSEHNSFALTDYFEGRTEVCDGQALYTVACECERECERELECECEHECECECERECEFEFKC